MDLKPFSNARVVPDGTSDVFLGRKTGTFFENVEFSKYRSMGVWKPFTLLLRPIFPEYFPDLHVPKIDHAQKEESPGKQRTPSLDERQRLFPF